MINAVIFDFDGVVCSTDVYHFAAWKALAHELGLCFDEEKNHRARGLSRMDALEILLEGSRRTYSEAEKAVLTEKKNRIYQSLIRDMTPEDVTPGLPETLETLRSRGVKLAIGSSSKNTRTILKMLGLTYAFDAIVDGYEITRSKPDPSVFLCAARKLGVPPETCAVVEDAANGIKAAKAARMFAVAFGGSACTCPQADAVIQFPTDILKFLL